MTGPKKIAVAVLALMGSLGASVALAERGMGGGEGRGAMMMQQFDTIDADKDGKISIAELEAHRKAEFAAADANGDGALSADELQAQMQARMLAARSARMIENMDDDGNGTLSEAEMGEGPIAANFARIDTDNDGMISKEEAEAAREHRRKRGDRGGMDDN
jgi:Ca2+-binding EF-hand superfamily protein